MNLRHLRTIRVVVSIFFFLFISFLFLDLGSRIPPAVISFLVSLQFIPSFLKLFGVLGISAIGLAGIVLVTIAFGRVYCSSICPLGTLQDFLIFFTNRIKGKRLFRYKKNNDIIQYGVLAATVLLALGGSLVLLDLLDPFSSFGRITTHLIRPAVLWVNNAAASILNDAQIYVLYQIPIQSPAVWVTILSVLFLGLVAYLCFDTGRLFCNLLCPVGAVMKLLSRFSFFRLVINTATCKDCGLCEKVCKARCIDSDMKRIDFGSCVSCFDCIDACPTVGIVYSVPWQHEDMTRSAVPDPRRRKAVRTMATMLLTVGVSTVRSGNTVSDSMKASPARKKLPITPPGSISVERFSQLCTACQLCVTACPTQAIAPSFLEYGIQGIFQPSLSYGAGYCKYDCNVCSQVCPSGAIAPVDVEAKKEIQLGKAQFVKDDCIVVAKKTECGACSEHCPTKAVAMVPYENLFLPELNNEICVGCGACERACPTKPEKAIYVESNPVHLRAKKPQVKKLEVESGLQEFPF